MSRTALVALALSVLATRPALALTVEVNFRGVVSEIVAFDYSTGGTPALAGEIGSSVAVGTRFSGSFSFDDADPDVSATSDQATYRVGDPIGMFGATLGDYEIVSNPALAFDLGIHDGDYYGYGITLAGVAHALTGEGASSLDSLTFDLALGTSSPDLLTPTALAAVPWELAAYDQGRRTTWLFLRGTEYVAVIGTLDDLSLAVPEPAVGGLAALGLLGAAGMGFRRARS